MRCRGLVRWMELHSRQMWERMSHSQVALEMVAHL